MTTSANIDINRSLKIITSTGKLQVTKKFAESNLSKSALKYAEKTDTHYLWDWGKDAYIVIFEIPKLFNANYGEIIRYMVAYCLPYLQENNLHDGVIFTKFMDNYNKKIKS